MNGCEAAGDRVLIQTSLLFSCKLCCCNSNSPTLTLEKLKGLYQSRVTGSLASTLRPGNLATTVKWSIMFDACDKRPKALTKIWICCDHLRNRTFNALYAWLIVPTCILQSKIYIFTLLRKFYSSSYRII